MRILVLNGPNLNLLGQREPEIYGTTTLAELDDAVVRWGKAMGAEVDTFQSNHEGELIDAIQRPGLDGIVLNAAAYTHTSRAIADAIGSVTTPVVEVHISNVRDREPWRAESVIADGCVRTIYGRGISGYRDAMRHLVNRSAVPFETLSYGSDPEQVGDLRRGTNSLVVLLHGGFWRQEFERDTMESLAVDITSRGFSTWNVEYRRIGQRGGWPESGEDVLAALSFTSELDVDTSEVTVIGHSAGGYMALWAAGTPGNTLAAVLGLAPITNLTDLAGSGVLGSTEAQALLDSGAPESVDPGSVPAVVAHGEADLLVPLEQSVSLSNAHDIDLVRTAGGHFDLLDPNRPHWPRLLEKTGLGG